MPKLTPHPVSAFSEKHFTVASWYGSRFFGHTMANGKRYKQDAMIAAHRTYPFGTKLKITNPKNNRIVVVTVEDRGPYVGPGRDLDLSLLAAQQLDIVSAGIALVSFTELPPSS